MARPTTPYLAAYTAHRFSAKNRGIPFRLSFEEWLGVWKHSRRLHLRGCKKGCFVMARHGDRGAYVVGNVSIVSMSRNAREGIADLPKASRAKGGRLNRGRPRPDLANLNKSREGLSLSKNHRQNIAKALRGKKRGPYKNRGRALPQWVVAARVGKKRGPYNV